jgi:hypothetical protein
MLCKRIINGYFQSLRNSSTAVFSTPSIIIRNDGVGGSNPSCGTIKINDLAFLSKPKPILKTVNGSSTDLPCSCFVL